MNGSWGGYSWDTESWSGPSITPVYSYSLEHDVVVTDLLGIRNVISLMELVDNVTIDDNFHVYGQKFLNILERTIVVSDRFNSVYTNIIEHDVNFSHSFSEEHATIKTLSDILTINSEFGRSMLFEIKTIPNFISTFERNVFYTRTLEDLETITSAFEALLFVSNPTHPVASGVPIVFNNLMTLQTDTGAVILPVPELSDQIKNTDQVTLRRAMSGFLFSYIKKGNTQALLYTWLLDFNKAAELKAWLKINMGKKIIISNWKGELWETNIISDSVSFVAESKYQGVARQKTSVTIEFEGKKLI